MARPCTLPNFDATLSGFQDEADGRDLWQHVASLLNVFGRIMNLSRLYWVTLSYDYAGALAQIDQGTGTGNVVTATNDEFATGVAMAVPILVNGIPRIHLVGNAALFSFLRKEGTKECAIALSTLAHECGHIHDLEMLEKACPGFGMKAQLPRRKAILFQMAQSCWSEYAACRLSAAWTPDEQTGWSEETFCSSCGRVRERGNAAIRSYNIDSDITKLLNCIIAEYGNVVKYASYLFGHIAGLKEELSDAAPKAVEVIKSDKLLGGIFPRLSDKLEEMWKSYENWQGQEVFEPLESLMEEVLKIAGLLLEPTPNGLYVRVLFTADTSCRSAGFEP